MAFLATASFAGRHSKDDQALGTNENADKSDKSADKLNKSKGKAAFDYRSLPGLRQQLQVSDDDWQVLLPRITKVQTIARQLYELRNPQKGFDSPKIPKASKDAAANPNPTGDAYSSAPPFYVVDLREKTHELKTMMADDSARPADIRSRLAAYRAARATAEKQLTADLAKARADLTELLMTRQELLCVMNGLLE